MGRKKKLISCFVLLLFLFNFISPYTQVSIGMKQDILEMSTVDEPIVPPKPKASFGPYRNDTSTQSRAYEPFIELIEDDIQKNSGAYKVDKINIKIKQSINNEYSRMSNSEMDLEDNLSQYGISKLAEIDLNSKSNGFELFDVGFSRQTDMWYNATLRPGYKVEEVISSLEKEPSIIVAEPDYIREVKGNAIPVPGKDPGILQQWHLDKARIKDAWNYLNANGEHPGGNRDIIVAVIDTGVDYAHPDLQGNMWINSGEIPGNGIDDDRNGYVDDIHGVDTITNTGNPQDDHGHGTHVAGIVGAVSQNDEGGVGVAFNVQIMAIKAAQSSGILGSSDIAKAINYAVDMGADVINMSFGGYGRSVLEEDALQRAFGSAVLVAAAGNDRINNEPTKLGKPMYPAAYNWVLGVMAQSEHPDFRGDNLAPFSNWDIIPQDSFEYEIMAPGVEIYSALPNGKYAKWSGTSMAAPVVAGVAALVRSQFSDKNMYSSRFIMGQIASTGDLKQGKTYSMSAPPTKHRELNAFEAITNTPKPEISYLEHYLFDKKDIDATNNEDGIADAGEILDLALIIRNHWGKAENVEVTLDTLSPGGITDPYIEFITKNINYGSVGSFNIDDNGLIYDDEDTVTGVRSPFTIKLAKNTPNDHVIKFNVNIEAKNGYDANDNTIYKTSSSFYITVRNGTVLPRIMSEDMILDKDTYWIIPDATLIPKGVTVSVEPGTQIQFWSSDPTDPYAEQQMAYLQVEGSFMVNGTEDEPVEIFASKLYPGYEVRIYSEGKLDYGGGRGERLFGQSQISYANIMNPKLWIDTIDHCYFSQDLYDNIYFRYEYEGKIHTGDWYGPVIYANKIESSRFYNLGNGGGSTVTDSSRLNIKGKTYGNIFDSCTMLLNNVLTKDNVFLKNHKLYKYQHGDRYYWTSKAENWGIKINTKEMMDSVFPVYRKENNSTYFAINPNMYDTFRPYLDTYGHNKHGYKLAAQAEMDFIQGFANYLGGNITTINSEDENQFIYLYINDYLRNNDKWKENYPDKSSSDFQYNHLIGLNDFDVEGEYKWISGETSSYFNWGTDQPNKPNSEYYFYNHVSLQYYSGEWESNESHLDRGSYIIEIPGQLTRTELEQKRDEYINSGLWNTFKNNAFLNHYSNPNVDSWMRFYGYNDRAYIQSLQNNYWGNISQTIMDKVIVDYQSGSFNRGTVLYKPILKEAPETAYPFVTDIYITNSNGEEIALVGAEEIIINVLFNRDMDTTIKPQVSFGPDAPYTDFTIQEDNGEWISPRHYQGTINITALTGDGKQFFRVAGAIAAGDKWLVTGNDSERFGFEVITSGTEAMNLQASGGENKITLSWMQDEFDVLAGYNLYRSEALDGTYQKINSTIIPYDQKSYEDTTVEPGKTYFYKFTVVKTDLSESDFSNVSFAAAFDTLKPRIIHTPINSATPGVGLQIFADITDNIKVQGAKLYYRTTGELPYFYQDMIKGQDNRFIANLPGSIVVAPGLDYYIEATDGVSTVRDGRPDKPHQIVINDSPKINAITPNVGTSSGLTTVTIMGSNFKLGAKVYFGDLEALNVELISPNQITATTPAHYPATVDVKIVNPDGYEHILLKGYTFKSSNIAVSIGNSNGNIGNIIEIPVHIQEVQGLRAIDLKINYDPEVLRLINVGKEGITSNFTLISNEPTQGQIIISMASASPINGTGNIVKMEFEVLGSQKLGTDIVLEEAKLNDGNINVDLINGRFDHTSTYQISGSVNYFKNYRPIEDVLLKLTGLSTYTKTTDRNGQYNITGISTGDYKLSPHKNNDVFDISAYDASLILQYVVKNVDLDDNQQIAADVNQNGNINSMDASYILEYVVGLLNTPFPGAGNNWKFNPQGMDINNITYDLRYRDFVGILLGDVSGSWNTGTEIQALSNVEYSVGSANINIGETALVPITIKTKGEEVYATELTIYYDDNMLMPIKINRTKLTEDFALVSNMNNPGEIKIALAGDTHILSDGKIIDVEFEIKGVQGSTDIIISNGKCNEDDIYHISNGQINIYGTINKSYIQELNTKAVVFVVDEPEVNTSKIWTIEFNDDIDKSTINDMSIFIWDNTNDVYIETKVDCVENILTIRPKSNEYLPNNEYTLYITDNIKSSGGRRLNSIIKMEFRTR